MRDPREAAERRLLESLEAEFGKQRAEIVRRIWRGERITDEELTEAYRRVLEPRLIQIALEEGLRLGEIAVAFDPSVVNAEAIAWARQHAYEASRYLTETTRQSVSAAVETFLTTPGMTRGQMAGLLEATFGHTRAEMIAITEVTNAVSAATNMTQERLSQEGVEMERVWRTSADERVCPICEPLNGKPESVWKDRFPNGPAAHVNCRCGVTLRVKQST